VLTLLEREKRLSYRALKRLLPIGALDIPDMIRLISSS